MDKKSLCVVFVCNKAFFNKFIYTFSQLITNGNYKGDTCLLIGDDLYNNPLLKHNIIVDNNVKIKHFSDIIFTAEFININNNIITDGRNITKKFQWHKLHLFNTFFKQWSYIFYLDCGMTIFSDMSPILSQMKENTLLAHSDAYPNYEWRLHNQFDKTNVEYFTKLNEKYNLDIDYFQTGVMLYDTNIIEEDTFKNLYNLSLEYPISKTNEQGIMCIYFTNIKPLFKQIGIQNEDSFNYDFTRRNKNKKYIMVKLV